MLFLIMNAVTLIQIGLTCSRACEVDVGMVDLGDIVKSCGSEGAWLGGFLPIFFVFTAFDLNTINERNTSTHQG